MENSKQSAFPLVVRHTEHEDFDGLTKREYFAAMAMQGILSNYPEAMRNNIDMADIQITAVQAVDYADALLEQLRGGKV
jgi:hypothetical protein